MQYDKKELEATLRSLESQVDDAERKAENLTGQLERLRLGLAELEQRETRLVLELDSATWPTNLNRERPVADIAIDLAATRTGIDELDRFIRDRQFQHREAMRELESRRGGVESFKREYQL